MSQDSTRRTQQLLHSADQKWRRAGRAQRKDYFLPQRLQLPHRSSARRAKLTHLGDARVAREASVINELFSTNKGQCTRAPNAARAGPTRR
jgi:hypothetical protein